jgi:pimeloyl-ACP methyl ester carboxylesterase
MNGALALAAAAEAPCRGVIAVAAAQQLPGDRATLEANWEARAEPERKARAAELTAAYEAADDSAKPGIFQRYDNLRRWYDIDAEPADNYVFTPEITTWVGSVIGSGTEIDWPNTFAKVTAPVLLALGEFDFAVPLAPWIEAIPGDTWTVETFARSGHTPFVEQPDEFVAAVQRWLKTI